MDKGKILKYYINYESKVNITTSKSNTKHYQINQDELDDFFKLKKNYELVKKDQIIKVIKNTLRKDDKKIFNEKIADLDLEEINELITIDYLKSMMVDKIANSIYYQVQSIINATDITIMYPMYKNKPLYMYDCILDGNLKVHQMVVNKEVLLLLLSEKLTEDITDILINYEKEITKFISYILTIDYQLDIKQITNVCNKELENLFNFCFEDSDFSSYAILGDHYNDKNYDGIREEFVEIEKVRQSKKELPELLEKYFTNTSSSKDISEYETSFYFGSFNSEYPVNETQFKITNSIGNENFVAVEGPPGTGKSSLLREIIAKTIVSRTESLIKNWQEPWKMDNGIYVVPFLSKDMNSILVTSKNGPAIDNIINDINGEIDYFSSIAKEFIIEENNHKINPNYKGIVCARLGNKNNKDNFFHFFEKYFLTYLKDASEEVDLDNLINEFEEKICKIHNIYKDIISIIDLIKSKEIDETSINNEIKDLNEKKCILDDKILNNEKNFEFNQSRIDNLNNTKKNINSDIDELSNNLNENIKNIEKYNSYSELSTVKLFFNKKAKKYLKNNSLDKLKEESKKYEKAIKDYNLQILDIELHIRELELKIEEIINNLNIITDEKNRIYDNILKNKLLLKNIKIYNNLDMQLQGNLKSYSSFYDVFSDEYLFKQRIEIFLLSLKINQAYIIYHKEEILHNFKIFWNGKYICQKYYNSQSLYTKENEKNIRNLWNTFSLCFPVITTTLDSLVKRNFQLIPELFDLTLIDEAGQILPHYVVPALYRSKKVLVVGDVHQLKPIENIRNFSLKRMYPDESENVLNHLEIENRSVQEVANKISEIKDKNNVVMLKDHYRCEENIIEFSKKYVYSKLIGHVENSNNKLFNSNLVMFDVRGCKSKREHKNDLEVKTVIRVVEKIKEFNSSASIGIITPFSKQKSVILTKLQEEKYSDVMVGTVHTFQGKENDYIIMSTVIDDLVINNKSKNLYSFIGKEANLLNVALTRAKKQFILVGNYESLIQSNNYLKKVIEIIKEKGKIYSLFLDSIEELKDNHDVIDILNISDNDVNDIERLGITSYVTNNLVIGPRDHYQIFKNSLTNVAKSFTVCSPWLGEYVLDEDMLTKIEKVVTNNIDVKIYAGYSKLPANPSKDQLINAAAHFNRIESTRKIYNRLESILKSNLTIIAPTHAKFLILDDRYLFIGSHNWLSNSGKGTTNEISVLVTNKETIRYLKKKISIKSET